MSNKFAPVLDAFGINPEACVVKPMGSGHVHDTYFIHHCEDGYPPLVLQKINHYIFRDVELLMHNLEIVTSHISDKNRKLGKNPACYGIVFLETDEGKSWTGNPTDGYWRLYWYIEDQVVFDVVPDSDVAFEGGAAIGSFQGMLTDLDASLISDSIPGFHDLQFRIGQFREAMEHGDNERIEYSSSLAEKIMHHQVDMLHVYERSRLNNLPVRITHNDAKFNNILFHNSKSADNPGFKANCLIDLDTVMKGYAWFDFGDALRTAGSTASEDEKRLRAIDFRLDIFEGFTKGYFQKGRDFLTNDEVELMHRAPAVFAYNQSMRFLTDYMTNDKYYKTNSKDHNYHRAMAQFRLMEKILEKQQVMKKIVDSTVE